MRLDKQSKHAIIRCGHVIDHGTFKVHIKAARGHLEHAPQTLICTHITQAKHTKFRHASERAEKVTLLPSHPSAHQIKYRHYALRLGMRNAYLSSEAQISSTAQTAESMQVQHQRQLVCGRIDHVADRCAAQWSCENTGYTQRSAVGAVYEGVASSLAAALQQFTTKVCYTATTF